MEANKLAFYIIAETSLLFSREMTTDGFSKKEVSG